MIRVNLERCTGCGACVGACPAKAIHIAGGHAVVDETSCRLCEACISACPETALSNVPVVIVPTSPSQYPSPTPSRAAIHEVPVPRAAVPWRERVLPALGALVGMATRYVIPHLAEAFLSPSKARGLSNGARRGGTGRHWQHRHRRGG